MTLSSSPTRRRAAPCRSPCGSSSTHSRRPTAATLTLTLTVTLTLTLILTLNLTLTLTLTQAAGGNRHQYLSAFYDGGQNDEIRLYFIKGGLRLAIWPEDKSPYCPAGNRGAPNPRRFTLSLSLSPTLTLAPTLALPHPSPDS